jgi:hypothetical protein
LQLKDCNIFYLSLIINKMSNLDFLTRCTMPERRKECVDESLLNQQVHGRVRVDNTSLNVADASDGLFTGAGPVLFNLVEILQGGVTYSMASGELTVPSSGNYSVNYHLGFENGGGTSFYFGILSVNGTTVGGAGLNSANLFGSQTMYDDDGGQDTHLSGSGVLALNAGDTVRVLSANSAGAVMSNNYGHLSVTLL